MSERRVGTIHTFVKHVLHDYSSWDTNAKPWFRGEPNTNTTPLLPKLYRRRPDGSKYDENYLVQEFRRMAPSIGAGLAPDRKETDLWLFLMQHVGMPTRLLDWTEGALIALYFALNEEKPVVWMLNPKELNRLSTKENIPDNLFPLTWIYPLDGSTNIGSTNIRAAWARGDTPLALPVAVKPTYIHPRMNAQKSCFTVHGNNDGPIPSLVPSTLLKKYVIMPSRREKILRELALLGITFSNLFPDLDALAHELEEAG